MRLDELAEAIGKGCRRGVIGISPGEKIHEIWFPPTRPGMASRSRTWSSSIRAIPGSSAPAGRGKSLATGFSTGATPTTEWLTQEQFHALLRRLPRRVGLGDRWRVAARTAARLTAARRLATVTSRAWSRSRSDWLTTGPAGAISSALSPSVSSREAVAVSNGTAALHAAVFAAGIGPGDEVITTAMTFAASANAARYQGATVVFADVDRDT